MLVEQELARVVPEGETALTLGVFDGVHLGHKSLIHRLRQKAEREGLISGVLTFHRHPRLILSPQSQLTYLTSIEERIRLLQSLGVELIVTLSFTSELAQLGAREFVALLKRYLRMRQLLIGPDFALGRGREGDAVTLEALGQELGFGVEVVRAEVWQGEVVSSTAIRHALGRGDMLKVNQLLGRHFRLRGQVIKGDERGKVLGFPTANLIPDPEQALPPDGVYAGQALLGEGVYRAVTNIGVRPTFGGGRRLIEVHLLDFEGELYGTELDIELVERLRGEERFASAEELRAQIMKDVERTRALDL